MSDTAQQIAIFEGESGEINVTLQQETVWLNQAQLAQLFAKTNAPSPSIFATFLKRASWKRAQLSGISGQLPAMVKATIPNTTTSTSSSRSAIGSNHRKGCAFASGLPGC